MGFSGGEDLTFNRLLAEAGHPKRGDLIVGNQVTDPGLEEVRTTILNRSDRPIDHFDAILDPFDSRYVANGFLCQLRVKKTVQPTAEHENSIVVVAKHVSKGGVRARIEVSFSNFGNFKRPEVLLHLD